MGYVWLGWGLGIIKFGGVCSVRMGIREYKIWWGIVWLGWGLANVKFGVGLVCSTL